MSRCVAAAAMFWLALVKAGHCPLAADGGSHF
jgi:hypothetical protein